MQPFIRGQSRSRNLWIKSNHLISGNYDFNIYIVMRYTCSIIVLIKILKDTSSFTFIFTFVFLFLLWLLFGWFLLHFFGFVGEYTCSDNSELLYFFILFACIDFFHDNFFTVCHLDHEGIFFRNVLEHISRSGWVLDDDFHCSV